MQSIEAWSIIRNLSFHDANAPSLARALCGQALQRFGGVALLESMVQSADEELQHDSVQILCNIARSVPTSALWACKALEREIMRFSSDTTAQAAAKAGVV